MWSMYIKPEKAPANPWDSLGLEWQTATPVPSHNFDRIPVIMTDPYQYGEAAPRRRLRRGRAIVRRRMSSQTERGRSQT